MNFTREPIIETIITPKEGCKLAVRSSKSEGQEEYVVDAVEVVSFGQALFFRSMEKPKAFLVPVGDYEVVEVKESRVVLKSSGFERTIKIGGGREAPVRREAPQADEGQEMEETSVEGGESSSEQPYGRQGQGRDRDRRRNRRRRSGEERHEMRNRIEQQKPETRPAESAEEGGGANDETQVSSSTFTNLIPPPTTLISDTISRYKDMGITQEPPSKPVEQNKKEEEKKKDDNEGGESTPMPRVVTEVESFQSTSFYSNWPS